MMPEITISATFRVGDPLGLVDVLVGEDPVPATGELVLLVEAAQRLKRYVRDRRAAEKSEGQRSP